MLISLGAIIINDKYFIKSRQIRLQYLSEVKQNKVKNRYIKKVIIKKKYLITNINVECNHILNRFFKAAKNRMDRRETHLGIFYFP